MPPKGLCTLEGLEEIGLVQSALNVEKLKTSATFGAGKKNILKMANYWC